MASPLVAIAASCREMSLDDARRRLVGVYLLVSQGEIVYVGQSTDIKTRIAGHCEERAKVFDRAFWFELPAADLYAVEGALIRSLNPEHNFSAPLDTGRDAAILATFGLAPNAENRLAFEARRRTRFDTPRRRSSSRKRRAA